jgi:hypothetical protein
MEWCISILLNAKHIIKRFAGADMLWAGTTMNAVKKYTQKVNKKNYAGTKQNLLR